jgi:endonuclease/exonuclease/phosphatase family metal-dependent hydrolase
VVLSRSGFDNAILADGHVALEDMPNPAGFQHPPQVAYVSYKGFDAVVVCLHLTWTDMSIRDQEIEALWLLVPYWMERDPDLMLVGDFNLATGTAEGLARRLGMSLMTISGQDGVGTTHSGNRYDHFLISADLASEEAVSARIETFSEDDLEIARRVSDHLPVVATFRVEERFRDRPSEN